MRIEIDIPKEFEEHFNQDKFKDSFERIIADIFHSLEIGNCLCAGRYEYETIEMLKKAFEDSKSACNVDKIVEELELHSFELGTDTIPVHYVRLNEAIEIVKQEAEQYNNGWVPCSVELPPQPVENPIFDNKPLELYLVSVKNADYPIRAFWNGKFFTDGWSKVDVIAWQPLQKPYHPKGE